MYYYPSVSSRAATILVDLSMWGGRPRLRRVASPAGLWGVCGLPLCGAGWQPAGRLSIGPCGGLGGRPVGLKRLRGLAYLHAYALGASAPVDGEVQRIPNPLAVQGTLQGIVAFHRLALRRDHKIAADTDLVDAHSGDSRGTVQTSFGGWRSGFHALDQQTALVGQSQFVGRVARDVYGLNPQVRPGHASLRLKLIQHRFSAVDGQREADPDVSLRPVDGRVDADYGAVRIQQRAAAVAWIDRRIGLNHVLQTAPFLRLQGTPQGTDHPGGQRASKSKRIANGQHLLSHLQAVGIAQLQERQGAVGLYSHQRQVVARVRAEHAGLVLLLVAGQRHSQLLAARYRSAERRS